MIVTPSWCYLTSNLFENRDDQNKINNSGAMVLWDLGIHCGFVGLRILDEVTVWRV